MTMADEENPVLNALAEITTASLNHCNLAPRELMLARIAGLAAVDAPTASYLLNAGEALEVGITVEDVQGILVAVAPIIGTPRIVAAASHLFEALGFAIGLEAEADAADED
jgi:alkylhydroperoxidase/carboxymuconolactone decarboxylase family protein YurZ